MRWKSSVLTALMLLIPVGSTTFGQASPSTPKSDPNLGDFGGYGFLPAYGAPGYSGYGWSGYSPAAIFDIREKKPAASSFGSTTKPATTKVTEPRATKAAPPRPNRARAITARPPAPPTRRIP
jgi:hypothetical protein